MGWVYRHSNFIPNKQSREFPPSKDWEDWIGQSRLTTWQAANWQFGRLGLSCCFLELEKSKQIISRKTTLTDNQELPGAAPAIRPEPSLNQEYLVSIGYGNSPKFNQSQRYPYPWKLSQPIRIKFTYFFLEFSKLSLNWACKAHISVSKIKHFAYYLGWGLPSVILGP